MIRKRTAAAIVLHVVSLFLSALVTAILSLTLCVCVCVCVCCVVSCGAFADDASSVGSEESLRVGAPTIPVAPPATLVNPDKPVPMATVPAHINTVSALTKQKLLHTILVQKKEQQKLLEQTIAHQLGQPPELLAQALKSILPVNIYHMTSVPIHCL